MIAELALFFHDGEMSPFIVPVAGCAMVLGIVVAGVWAGTRNREIQSQERLAAIAAGVPIPPTPEELAIIHGKPSADQARRRANIRLTGIILLGVATGLIAFFAALTVILNEHKVLCGAAVGLIPLGIGLGFLWDARIQSREMETTAQNDASTPLGSSF